jgi:hypothetical protein
MKKWIAGLVVVICLSSAVGCASVQKKFTRKKKEPKHIPAAVYFDEGPYQKKYSNDYYYKTHFTLWKTWHGELLTQFGGNNKKVTRCAQETLNHLTDMHKYLTFEKQAELEPQLTALKKITERLETRGYGSSEEAGVRTELEKIRRIVANDFYYDKIKTHLAPDTVELGAADAAPAQPQPASSTA